MIANLRLLFAIPIFFIGFCGFSQQDFWQESNLRSARDSESLKNLSVKDAKFFNLQETAFKEDLAQQRADDQGNKMVYFPDETGAITAFKIKEAAVFSPELAAKYPQIKSYKGVSLENPAQKIRFSVSPKGIQTMLVDEKSAEASFMQKTSEGSSYLLYTRRSLDVVDKDFVCATQELIASKTSPSTTSLVVSQELKRYRIAISATGEYTQFHGGTVPDALAAINATLTRINMVFETDLAITLELVANTDAVIYTNAATDPYNGNLNAQAQNTFTQVIGEANYDIGHLLNRANNSGDAGFIGSVCKDGQKGSAFSSGLIPEGDLYDIDFVAHEMGHQFGANHTWSFASEGTLVQVEPGSGTTIMGYAGITGVNNVAANGQDYFHYVSIQQITNYLATTSCAVNLALSNNPPVIAPLSNYIIPKGTAFVLTGNAADADVADVLTYTWEQIDNGTVTNVTFGPNNPSGANFRSQKPTTNPQRYFPSLSRVIQGNLTQRNPTINSAWETVSNVERTMNFALSVRDNAAGGGQVSSATLTVDVVHNAGPFSVSSQNTAVSYEAGSIQTLTWEVASTNEAPVNAQLVDVFLSVDGGQSFPIMVAEAVKNDGSHDILIPNQVTNQARLMVKANNNIFFAVNSSNFSITPSAIVLNLTDLSFDVCQPDAISIPFEYETDGVFLETATFSVTGLPPGLTATFAPASAFANNTSVTLTLSNSTAVDIGDYNLQIVATAASSAKQVPISLGVLDTSFTPVQLSTPSDGTTDTNINPLLQWIEEPFSTAYDIEIATDLGFTTIVDSETLIFNEYSAKNLLPETTYFWRVKPKNDCGEGVFSTPFSFTTPSIDCKLKFATNLPQSIAASGTPVITSVISFVEDLPVADVDVDLNITHTFLADLTITLTSPEGTSVVLVSNSCGDNKNINATFDGSASSFICGTTPAISGIIRPLGSLASFNGESAQGDWILEIQDNAGGDGGALNSFGISLCVEGEFRPDDDNDGVFDDGDDLCLGTALGQEVNADGCPVFRFEPTNFSVSLLSESCRDNNDGVIQISAVVGLNYTVNVVGNGVNSTDIFTTDYELNDLAAGTYTVCITGTDGVLVYEAYCFDVVITEPDELLVFSNVSADGTMLNLSLNGASNYLVTLNGVLQEFSRSNLILELKNGLNTLKVTTDLPCQGVYENTFIVADKPFLYPNPATDLTYIFTGIENRNASVQIFALDGRLLKQLNFGITTPTELELNVSELPVGVYLVLLTGSNLEGRFKLIKE